MDVIAENNLVNAEEKGINQNIERVLLAAVENLDEIEAPESDIFYDWGIETITVRTLLKRYKEGKIQLPLCQRLYVWDEKKRASLLDSIRKNLPCGTIIVTESEGVQYLLDGLQRTTSLMMLSNDSSISKDEQKLILDYKICLTIVHDISLDEMKCYFGVLNSGVILAAAVKERSKLSEKLNDAILTIASHPFFRSFNEEGGVQVSSTFAKSHHHEIIAMNVLLSVSGIPQGENKAKTLCKMISEHEHEILSHIDAGLNIISKFEEIYKNLDVSIAKRSLSANFLSSLAYVLAENDYSSHKVQDLINYIFASRQAVKAYAMTTRTGASDSSTCLRRTALLSEWLKNPPYNMLGNEENNTFVLWSKRKEGGVVKDGSGEYMVDFSSLENEEKYALYMAEKNQKKVLFDAVIKKAYERMDAEAM